MQPDMKNYELLKAFYAQKHTAKAVNSQVKLEKRRAKRNTKHHLSPRVRPNQVKYNKGFHLIDGDCLYGQKPVSDKTQIREGEYLVIQ